MALAATIACSAGHRDPQLVAAGPRGVAAKSHDYGATLASIADRLERDMGLPRVEVTLLLYATRRDFEQGLIDVGYPRPLARRAASAFLAIGGARSVMVNESVIAAYPWEQRVRLLAHELVHSVQYRLTGGVRGTSEQWLREGFAEYIACQTISGLGFGTFERWRDEMLAPLVDIELGTRPAPFSRLRTFPQWVAAQSQRDVPLYTQAFAAAELLIEQKGLPAVTRYFSLTPAQADADLAFTEAFALKLDRFEREFEQRWHRLVGERSTRGTLRP